MKRGLIRALWLVALLTVTGCATSFGQPNRGASMRSPGNQVELSDFYEGLSPYGEWIHNSTYGWCWTPYDISANWRPYRDGRWQYTDYGWSWASNESWGWAPYHYGRWFFDDSYGWVWVPGTEWAPAWVAWRYGDDWVGWAPLPPMARWNSSAGLAYGDADRIPSHEWCFVPRRKMLDVKLSRQVASVAINITLLGRSRDATRFEVRNGRPANVGIDVAQIEGNGGQRVTRRKVIDVETPGLGSGKPVGRDGVGFFRPKVETGPAGQAPPRSITERKNTTPEYVMQRQRVEQQRKVESDLAAERETLTRNQASELRAQGKKPGVDEVRKRQATEQQAFEAHAVQQRRVVTQRIEKEIMKPGKAASAPKPSDQAKNKGRGQGGK